MHRRTTALATALVVAAALALTACGGDDPAAPGDASTTTASTEAPADETTTTTAEVATTTTAVATATDGCDNDLVIAGSEVADGPVDVAMAITDQGPHPANTVDADAALEGAIATYELEADPQFGLGVPVGVPHVPEGGVILTFFVSLTDQDATIGAGSTFVDQTSDEPADGVINSLALYAGAERINPLGDTTITITALDDERVCGTIEAVDATELQTFPTITGTFVADRLQALEAG